MVSLQRNSQHAAVCRVQHHILATCRTCEDHLTPFKEALKECLPTRNQTCTVYGPLTTLWPECARRRCKILQTGAALTDIVCLDRILSQVTALHVDISSPSSVQIVDFHASTFLGSGTRVDIYRIVTQQVEVPGWWRPHFSFISGIPILSAFNPQRCRSFSVNSC